MFFNIFAIVISAAAFAIALAYLPKYIKQRRWGTAVSFGFWCIVNVANIALSFGNIIAAETHLSVLWRITYACGLALAFIMFAILHTVESLRKMNNNINEAIVDPSKLEEGDEIIITFKKL